MLRRLYCCALALTLCDNVFSTPFIHSPPRSIDLNNGHGLVRRGPPYKDYAKPFEDDHDDDDDDRRGGFHNHDGDGGSIDLRSHPWIPASQIPGSSRSPCPLLNTLANHGFLPRNGKNISMTQIETAQSTVLNLSPSFAALLTSHNFHLLGLIPSPSSRTDATIDLETLNNYTMGNEHDASLSKADRLSSPSSPAKLTEAGTPLAPIVPDYGLVKQILRDAEGGYVTVKSLGLSVLRRRRQSVSSGSPPLRPDDIVAGFREAGLIVQFVGEGGDPNEVGGGFEVWDSRVAKKNAVAEWLTQERFPRGWRRTRSHQITAEGDMLPLAARVEYWYHWWQSQGEANGTFPS